MRRTSPAETRLAFAEAEKRLLDPRPASSPRTFKHCLADFTSCEASFKSLGDEKRAALSLFRKGQVLGVLGRFNEALRSLKTAAQRLRSAGSHRDAVKAMAESGSILRRLGRLKEAERVLRQCIKVRGLGRANSAGLRLNLAHVLTDRGEYRSALAFLDEASARFRAAGETGGAATAILSGGTLRFSLGLLDEADDRFRSAERLFKQTGDRLSEARCMENLALIRITALGATSPDEHRALKQSALVYRSASALSDLARVYANISYAYRIASRPRHALRMAEQSLKVALRAGSSLDAVRAEIEMAHALCRLDGKRNAQSALATASSAAQRIGRRGPTLLAAQALVLMAEASSRLARCAEARKHLHRAAQLMKRGDSVVVKATLPWCDGEGEEVLAHAISVAVGIREHAFAHELMRKTRRRLLSIGALRPAM